MVELKILVQRKEELDVGGVVDFVSNVSGVRLVVFHCSIVDDGVLEGFVRELQTRLSVPFVGVRVSASLTNSGFHEDSVVVGVFSGDFKVSVYHDKLDFEHPEKTIDSIVSRLPEKGLCLAYAACYLNQGVNLDYVFRNINFRRSLLQFSGSLSSPQHFVFSNDGVFKGDLVYCVFEGVEFNFKLESGLGFQGDSKEYIITKASEYAINEIDNTNAVKLYCGLKHIRPYFVNTLVGTLTKPDVHKIVKFLSNANETLYNAILKSSIEMMGSISAKDLIEIVAIFNLDEEKSKWLSQSYKPVGTRLRWLDNEAKNQFGLYDKIRDEFKNTTVIFGHECVYRLFWMNFRIKDIEKKTSRFKVPLMLSYGYGEFGAYTPYKDITTNVMHAGIMQVLGFK